MKKILFILAMLVPMLSWAQEQTYTKNNDGSITFERILTSEGKSADILYSDIEGYIAQNYADAKNVVQTKNKEQYFIIGQGVFPDVYQWTNSTFGIKTKFSIPHIVRIDCKDGKVRVQYTISNYDELSGNWVHFERSQSLETTSISSKYPIAPPKKENKLNKSEKRYGVAFANATAIIENEFTNIQNCININHQDW